MSIGLKEFIDKYSGFAVVFSKNLSNDNYLASYTVYKDGERFNSDVAFDKEDEVDLNTIMNDVLNSFDIYLNKGYTTKDTEADKILRDGVEEIKIKYHTDKIDKLDYIDGKSDWIDLRAAEDVELKKGEFALIPLSISVKLPDGYEAWIAPRSSTFKNFGIIQANSIGR